MRALALLAATMLAGASSGAQRPGLPQGAERDSLEARVQMRMAQMLRTQLGLNDDQIRRLQAVNRRIEPQRRALFQQEREVRQSLHREMQRADSADQARIATLLDRTFALQRSRMELLESEQKELATFLTPMQRAQLFGIEEQIRRRMMEMRQQGPPGGRQTGPPDGVRRPGAATPAGPRRPPAGR